MRGIIKAAASSQRHRYGPWGVEGSGAVNASPRAGSTLAVLRTAGT